MIATFWLLMFALLLLWLIRRYPGGRTWKPLANAESECVGSYRRAAKAAGIRLRFGTPVPCPASGSGLLWGLTGVYIHRDDAKRERELIDGYFNNRIKETGQNPYNCDV